MSQKTILSFFKSAEPAKAKETKSKCVAVETKSSKNQKKKRKVQCIESDDESSDIPNKKLNGECSKASKPSDEKEKLNGKKEETSSNSNENVSLPKPSEQKKIENGVSDPPKSPTKCEQDISNHKESSKESDVSLNKTVETNEKPSSSSENNSVDFVPKRKTARKQMKCSGTITIKNAKEPKEDSISVKEIASNSISESKKTDEREITNVEKETKDSKSSESEKSISNSISELKETNEDENTISEKETNDIKSSESEKSKNSEKNVENKKSPRTLKKSDVKQRTRATKKDKGSPVKKTPKKESIQNFFAPRKAAENKSNETESSGESIQIENEEEKEEITKKSPKIENDDSPVKKVPKMDDDSPVKKPPKIENDDSPIKKITKKKTNCLESDDDNDESAELSVKEEQNVEVSSSESPEKEQAVEKSSNSIPEPNKSSLKDKKKEDTSSEKNEKQKLSIKSTSAVDVYDPSKNNYHPIDDAFWKRNEKVPYLALAKTMELIENTSGRLKTIEILSNFFRSVIVLSPDDFLHSVYLCLNRVAPEYEGIEMGVGETLLMKAVAQATGRTVEKIKAEVAIKGDLGLVSESSRSNQRVMFAPPKLTVSAVFNKFLEIAKMSGNSAMAKKTDKIKSLFIACRDCEAKYIIRSLSGKLRIGLAEQSIVSAIARAVVLTPPGQEYPPKKIDTSIKKSPSSFKELLDAQTLILKTAYCECPNYDKIIPVLLTEGILALPDKCQLSPGVPLKPMLAHPTAGVDIVLARFDKNAFTCEFKYDGERAQIHRNDKGEVKIFSRNQEDNTSKYPDIISWLSEALKESTTSFILDSEAVAYDREAKQILPFQVLSTRKRKDAVESEIVVQVCVMAFDLLYLNGESLVKKPLIERRRLLHSSFNEIESKFMFAEYRDGDNAEAMQEFLDVSVKGNCEGLMVKALEVDASYEIAKRSHNWLKLKKDYLQGIGDTLDLVVIGGYLGKGKRTGNYGGFLLACYDNENEEFQSICKLGTGFKDDVLEAHTKFLKQHIIKEPKKYYRYDHSLEPDEWFEPVQVWEIKCADLSISPVHKAAVGIVDPKKGISLRFPRFIRIRDDKSVEDATNAAQIADMYQNQEQIQNTKNKNLNIEEDYY